MTKKTTKSIIQLAIMGLVAILGALLCFCSWYIPGTYTKVNSFADSIKLGLDLKGGVYAVYEAKSEGVDDFAQKLETTKTRLTDLLTKQGYDATLTTEGTNNLRVEVPDVADPTKLFSLIGKPCQVVFVIDDEIVMYGKNQTTGENYITGAKAYYDTNSGGYAVLLEMTANGAGEFGVVTGNNVGKQMSIYLVYDEDFENLDNADNVTTATIQSKIQGNATITGQFDETAAKDMATKIESGTFALTLSLIESSTMPASLGERALSTALIAGLLGLIIIIIFLVWRYRLLGLVATLSLVLYSELMLFFLAAIPWVQLTLAGIAGIILSIGMAIDGNVIIYERMKEEYAAGKTLMASYHAGFSKATSSIIDGNVTTILAAVILLVFGMGSIKGFGLTLLIGIVLSLFTSLILNRFLVKSLFTIVDEGSGKAALFNFKSAAQVSKSSATVEIAEETEDKTTETDASENNEGGNE
jgi:SecD/SecF fusion protein